MPSSTFACTDYIPEIKPLMTVSELLEWSPNDALEFRLCRARHPLPTTATGLRVNRPRFLCCHDMRGNYLEDRLLQGGSTPGDYVFRHFDKIDGFVYFSHKLVTIPPPGWVESAHRMGVPVLGTLITEWNDGEKACQQLLASDATAQHAAHQLSTIAKFLNFDGWVVNIENDISPSLVPRLIYFLQCLTTSMHSAVPHSGTIIWYDAVTIEGKLEWQNALTHKNSPFFDVCDGIWLNYTWTEQTPATSRVAAGDRVHDVYMGVDAFGRGTYGGGQLCCNVSFSAASREGLSCALFACGWPYETYQAKHGHSNNANGLESKDSKDSKDSHDTVEHTCTAWHIEDTNFWKCLSNGISPMKKSPLASTMLYTEFNQGMGTGMAIAGHVVSQRPWYNVSLLSPLPIASFRHRRPPGIKAGMTTATAYHGGSCLQIHGNVKESTILRLFSTNIPITPAPRASTLLRVKVTLATCPNAALVSLCLKFKNGRDNNNNNNKYNDNSAVVLELPCNSSINTSASGAANLRTTKLSVLPAGHSQPQSWFLKQHNQTRTTPLQWLTAQSMPPANLRGLPASMIPREWTTFTFTILEGDFPSQSRSRSLLSGLVLSSVDFGMTSRTVGTTSPCNVFIGALEVYSSVPTLSTSSHHQKQIASYSDLFTASCCNIHHFAITEVSIVTLKQERQQHQSDRCPATLSAVLTWEESEEERKRQIRMGLMCYYHVYVRCGVTKVDDHGQEGCHWSERAEWVGLTCGTAFYVRKFPLPEGTVAVKFNVMPCVQGMAPPLRSCPGDILRLPQGVASSHHAHVS